MSLEKMMKKRFSPFLEVLYKRNLSTASQADEPSTSVRSTLYGTIAIEVAALALASFN